MYTKKAQSFSRVTKYEERLLEKRRKPNIARDRTNFASWMKLE